MDISDALFGMDRHLRQKGLPPLAPQKLKQLHDLFQSKPEIMNAVNAGQITPELMADAAMEEMQKRSGLPLGGSRIAGDVNPGGQGFGFRTPQFQSQMPLPQAIGPARTPAQMPEHQSGFTAMNPVMDMDQARLRRRLQMVRGPI